MIAQADGDDATVGTHRCRENVNGFFLAGDSVFECELFQQGDIRFGYRRSPNGSFVIEERYHDCGGCGEFG